MRLVLINTKENTYTVYEGKVPVAVFMPDDNMTPSKEDIEQIRLASYNVKA